MSDINLDFDIGPERQRNHSEEEVFLKAKTEHFNSNNYRLSVLIRLHKLPFKRVSAAENCRKHDFKRQDLIVHIRR